MKSLLILSLVLGSLALSGCLIEERRYSRVSHSPGYYGNDHDDFYYTSGRPYSRSYGVLTVRDGRHYYRRGGRSVVYDRPTYAYRGPARRVETRSVVRERGRSGYSDRNPVYEGRDVRVRY